MKTKELHHLTRGWKNCKKLHMQAIEMLRLITNRNPYIVLLQPLTKEEKRIKRAYYNELAAHYAANRAYCGDLEGYDYTTTEERAKQKHTVI